MMIQEYKMLEAWDPKKLTKEVNEHLEGGWLLHGSSMVAVCDRGASYVQSVVREVEQPGAWG